MSDERDAFRGRFMRTVCQHDYLMYLAFTFEVMLLLLAVLSFLYADLDRSTRSILILDFVLLGGLFTGTVGLIYVCNSRVFGPVE